MVSASAAVLSSRYRTTRAQRSAIPPGLRTRVATRDREPRRRARLDVEFAWRQRGNVRIVIWLALLLLTACSRVDDPCTYFSGGLDTCGFDAECIPATSVVTWDQGT